MESGGTLTISSEDTNIYNQIIIADMGCGIAKEDLPHIFERFYKGKNAIKDSVGIGLALAKSIITSQHGDILVESKEGIGTKFFIRFIDWPCQHDKYHLYRNHHATQGVCNVPFCWHGRKGI